MSLFRGKSAPSARIFLAAFFFCIAIFWTLSRIQYHTETDADRNGEWSLAKSPPDKAFVVASQRHENTSWLVDGFPDWHKYIYVVNDPYAGELTVERNKGRESMVYLSYDFPITPRFVEVRLTVLAQVYHRQLPSPPRQYRLPPRLSLSMA